ncbi:hypothetical protein QR680_018327 [Steinernema hermaphroditum]|uniref:Uncharacterized protein n=1 Tax=Steinernema hermaphroditum TaxID=289476 RepID=A0AA39HIV9_9BILA|nr:hypothetical protein QR680_018327 [Steinernema hermaphroditum]
MLRDGVQKQNGRALRTRRSRGVRSRSEETKRDGHFAFGKRKRASERSRANSPLSCCATEPSISKPESSAPEAPPPRDARFSDVSFARKAKVQADSLEATSHRPRFNGAHCNTAASVEDARHSEADYSAPVGAAPTGFRTRDAFPRFFPWVANSRGVRFFPKNFLFKALKRVSFNSIRELPSVARIL